MGGSRLTFWVGRSTVMVFCVLMLGLSGLLRRTTTLYLVGQIFQLTLGKFQSEKGY